MAQTTTALKFQRKFGWFQLQARREPIEITRHRRRTFVLMSADHYDRLVAAARPTQRSVVAENNTRATTFALASTTDNP